MEASLRCSKPRPCKQQANALQVDGPEATVRKAWPVTVTPVGLLAMRCMGLWPSSAMVVAPELLERKWHWMGTRSTKTMIAICSPFRRHRKEAHEEKAEDHYHGSQARYFQTLCKKKDGYPSPALYTRRKNDAADGVLPIRHGGDGAYAHASLVIRHGGDGASGAVTLQWRSTHFISEVRVGMAIEQWTGLGPRSNLALHMRMPWL